jgi:hypothetical protein
MKQTEIKPRELSGNQQDSGICNTIPSNSRLERMARPYNSLYLYKSAPRAEKSTTHGIDYKQNRDPSHPSVAENQTWN